MLEKSYYSDITKYYERTTTISVAWEAKFVRNNRMLFSALAVHQEENLLRATAVHGFKIADSGIGQKPYDGYVLYGARAVIIVIYFVPRATEIYEIPIRNFIQEKYSSTEKSLTKERAQLIGTRIFL